MISYKDLDVNKSLIDQVLTNNKSPTETLNSTFSSIDEKLQKQNHQTESVSTLPSIETLKINTTTTTTCVNSYLESIGATVVPFDLFEHVVHSVKKYLKLNIKVEYLYDVEKQLYWFAIIKYTYGNLLYLKFLVPKLDANDSGHEDNSNNTSSANEVDDNDHGGDNDDDDAEINSENFYFFYLLNHEERVKPIGWCKRHKHVIKIPEFIYDKLRMRHQQSSIQEKIEHIVQKNVHTLILGNFFDSLNRQHVNNSNDSSGNLTTKCLSQLKINQILELQDFSKCSNVWFVRIVDNVGGRLLLEYYEVENVVGEKFWLFYLDIHLHYLGWARNNSYEYKSPSGGAVTVRGDESAIVENVLSNNMTNNNSLIIDLFKNQHKLYPHRFQVGHMIEVLHENKFYVAHLVELLGASYFKAKLHVKNDVYVNFTSTSQSIFPFKWCEQNGISLQLPHNWPNSTRPFSWDDYIDLCNKHANKAGHYVGADQSLFSSIISRHLTNICEKYKIGSYLECVSPLNSNEICVGQIKLRVKHLLFIKIKQHHEQLYVYTQNSLDLFPIGWCEMNNYKNFVFPNEFLEDVREKTMFQIRSDLSRVPYLSRFNDPELWCDSLHLNINYNYGPELSLEKIYKLPKRIGPGPIVLVISTLIRLLINSSKSQFKVLKLLQMARQERKRKNMVLMKFKAKSDKEKVLEKQVEICTRRMQLNEYLSQLSVKLNCCLEFISFKEPLSTPASFKCTNEDCLRCSTLLANINLNSVNTDKATTTSKANTILNKLPKRVIIENNSGINRKPKVIKTSIKLDPMKTRQKIRNESLDACTSSGYRPRSKMMKLDDKQQQQQQQENKYTIEIHDEEDESGEETTNSNSSNNAGGSGDSVKNGYYKSDPLTWSVEDVCNYLKNNELNDERIIRLINQNEFDGQSFLMLNLPFIQKFTDLKLGPSVKLLNLVEKLKVYYFKTFVKTRKINQNDDDEDDDDSGDDDESDDMEIENQDENFNRLD